MRSLTDEQIDFIADDIRIRGVFTQSLQENLLDHICCFLEEQDDERPFEEVYLRALDAFGQNGLQGVQDETLYLVNRPYLTKMKKIAFISAAVSGISLVGGALFKIQHWPGANILMLLGTFVLAFFFIPYFFYVQLTEQTEKKGKIIAALGLITALLLATAAVFKLLHWPGTFTIFVGFIVFFLTFLPLYIINGARNPVTRFSTVSNGLLFACIGGFMMLMSFSSSSKSVTDSLSVIEQNQTELLSTMKQQLNESSNATPAEKQAIAQFITACDQSLIAVAGENETAAIENGTPINTEDLDAFNTRISDAVNTLNTTLAYSPEWKPVGFKKIEPTLYGSLRFQIMQLEVQAYLHVMQ